MIRDITLGQYFPSGSVIHRLDPRTKIMLALVFMVAVFFAGNPLSYAALAVICVALTLLSRIPLRLMLKGLKPLVFIAVFTAFFNIFFTKGETLLVNFWFVRIYAEGLVFAAYMIVRLVCLVAGTTLFLSYTTTPIELTHGLESLLRPLSRIGVPTHEFAMMISIALRFIPTLIEETDKIIAAQKARGADFESGNLVRRAKAFVPILVPLFVSAFRRADELATAMECRCYNGSAGRTHMRRLRFTSADLLFTLAFVASLGGMIALAYVF